MRSGLLDILVCPHCRCSLRVDGEVEAAPFDEIRTGQLTCTGSAPHTFAIEHGIVRLTAGFDAAAVQTEINYSQRTFGGDRRLTDPEFIARYPESLGELRPHCSHFGPDFRDALKHLQFDAQTWTVDIGTGTCWTTRLLAEQPGRAIAMDVVDTPFNGLPTAEIAFNAHGVHFERVLESMTNMPFRNRSIDNMVFNASFHHSPDERATLRESHRVLKPGGKVLMLYETVPQWKARWRPTDDSQEEGSSHHDIEFPAFVRWARALGFDVQTFITPRLRGQLTRRLGRRLGHLASQVFDRVPRLLGHVSIPLVILTKA